MYITIIAVCYHVMVNKDYHYYLPINTNSHRRITGDCKKLKHSMSYTKLLHGPGGA